MSKSKFADSPLRDIASHIPLAGLFPLLLEVPLDPRLYSLLLSSVRSYLFSSLQATYKPREPVDISVNPLFDYYKELTQLPNITPNGLLMPKRENCLEFNLVHRAIGYVFASLGIDNFVDRINLPAMLRMVDGKKDLVKDSRPYASVKLHSDLWNGDPLNELIVIIPVMGDIEHTTIEFFEPDENVMQKWLSPLTDYNDGVHLLNFSTRYDCIARHGFLYLMDPRILHRTVKDGGGLRINVDFHFIPHKKISCGPESRDAEADLRRNFVSPAEWYAVGKETFFLPNDTFAETSQKFVKTDLPKETALFNPTKYFKVIKLS